MTWFESQIRYPNLLQAPGLGPKSQFEWFVQLGPNCSNAQMAIWLKSQGVCVNFVSSSGSNFGSYLGPFSPDFGLPWTPLIFVLLILWPVFCFRLSAQTEPNLPHLFAIGAFTIANFGQNNDQTFCAKFGQTAPWEPNLDQTRCFGLKNCWSSRAPTVPNSAKLMNQTVPRTFADSVWNLNCIYRTLQNHILVSSYCERSKETTKLCPNNPQNSLVLLAQLVNGFSNYHVGERETASELWSRVAR